jgi:hypothetical protein
MDAAASEGMECLDMWDAIEGYRNNENRHGDSEWC